MTRFAADLLHPAPTAVRAVPDFGAVVPDTPIDELLAAARAIRDAAHGTRITYSPKVFVPLTMLCRDQCGYCTFAQPPARPRCRPQPLPRRITCPHRLTSSSSSICPWPS